MAATLSTVLRRSVSSCCEIMNHQEAVQGTAASLKESSLWWGWEGPASSLVLPLLGPSPLTHGSSGVTENGTDELLCCSVYKVDPTGSQRREVSREAQVRRER